MKEMIPSVRIIISIRNPVERSFSQYYHDKPNDTLLNCINRDLNLLNESGILTIIDDINNSCKLDNKYYSIIKVKWRSYIDSLNFHWTNRTCQAIIGRSIYWPQIIMYGKYFNKKIFIIRMEELKQNSNEVLKHFIRVISG